MDPCVGKPEVAQLKLFSQHKKQQQALPNSRIPEAVWVGLCAVGPIPHRVPHLHLSSLQPLTSFAQQRLGRHGTALTPTSKVFWQHDQQLVCCTLDIHGGWGGWGVGVYMCTIARRVLPSCRRWNASLIWGSVKWCVMYSSSFRPPAMYLGYKGVCTISSQPAPGSQAPTHTRQRTHTRTYPPASGRLCGSASPQTPCPGPTTTNKGGRTRDGGTAMNPSLHPPTHTCHAHSHNRPSAPGPPHPTFHTRPVTS